MIRALVLRRADGLALRSGLQRAIGTLLRDRVRDQVTRDPGEDGAAGNEVMTGSLPPGKATIASRLSLTPG